MSSGGSPRRDRRALLLSGLLFLIAVIGLLHVAFGEWRPSPGGNPWLVPMLALVVMLITSVLMAFDAWRRPAMGPVEPGPGLMPAVVAAGWAIAFFLAVRWLGLASGSFLLLVVAMVTLSSRFARALTTIVPLSALAALALWLLFTRLAPVVLPDPLLF